MATKNIGGSITLEGANKYNQDLKQIKSNLVELRSEMKAANAANQENANSYQALAQKEEILNKQIEQTSKKLEIYNKLYDESAKKQQKAEESITTYSSKLQEAQKELERMKTSGTATDEELKAQEKIVNELSKELEKAQNSYNSASLKMNQYSTAANNTNAELSNLDRELATNEKYLEECKTSADGTATSIDRFGKLTSEAGEGIKKTADAVQLLANSEAFKAISEGAKQVTETLLECVEASTKWGTSMAKVQSIAQVSDERLAGMGKSIQELSTEYGVGANEIAEATYQAISASVDAAEATEFVENSIKLARGGFTDVTSAVDVMTTVTNAYGKEANTTAHIMDTLIQTQNLGKTTVNELAESMGMVIPTAAAYNVNLDNIASAYIQLTKNGINTANATTMINGMLTELADAGSAVSKTLNEKTGKSFGQLMKSGKSLGEVIQILGDSVNGDSEAFANLWGNVRAGRGAVTLFNNGAQAFNDSLQAIADSAGAADQAFATMADTAEMTDQRLAAATENLKVAIGEALEPTLNSLKQSGIEALQPLTEFVEENPILIQTLAGTVTAVAGVATAVTACAAAVAILKAAFGDLSGAAAVLGTAAVLGGVTAYTAGIEAANDKVGNLTREARELNKELENGSKSRQETREEFAQTATNAKRLADELVTLQSKTKLTKEEQARQKEIVAELNTIVPNLNLAIDDQTGKLNMSTEALRQNIDELMNLAKVQAAQEDLVSIGNDMYQAEKQLNDLEKEMLDTYGLKVTSIKDVANAYDEMTASFIDASNNVSNGDFADADKMKALGETILDTKDKLEGFKEEFQTASDYIEENGAAAEATAASLDALGESADNTGDSVSEASDEISKATESLRESVQSAVTSVNPLFDSLADESKESLKSVAQNLEENAKKSEEFASALNAATDNAKYGTNRAFTDLVNILSTKGTEATGLLEELVKGAEGGTERYNTLMKNMKKYLDGEDSVTAAVAKLTTDLTQGMTDVTTAATEGEANLTTVFTEEGTKQKEAIQQTADDITEIAGNGVKGAAKAVSDNSSQVTTATKTAADDAVNAARNALQMSGDSSATFKKMGSGVMKSFADGVKSEQGTVRNALQSVLQNAIDSMDLSGLAGRINKILGSALNS